MNMVVFFLLYYSTYTQIYDGTRGVVYSDDLCITAQWLCLPTPLTLVCGGSPIIPLLVHQPASQAGSVHKSRGDNVVRMWVQLKR